MSVIAYIGSDDGFANDYPLAVSGNDLDVEAGPGTINVGQSAIGGTGYSITTIFLEFDTSAVVATPASVSLTLTANGSQFVAEGQTLDVAAFDFGGVLDTADWLSPATLSGLAVAGAHVIAPSTAFGDGDTLVIALSPSVINLGGLTRLVVFSDEYASGTTPTDSGQVLFDGDGGRVPSLNVVAGGGGGGGGGVATCIAVELGGFVFDGVTEDGDGIVYDWQDLAGWWDSPDLATVVEQNAFGVTETVVNVGGRSITLTGVAHFPTRGTVLGDLAPKAMRTVKRACGAMFASKILRVDESDLILQARVRQSGPMRFKLGSNRVSVTFQIPLLAPDPRRYDATPQTVATSSSFSATNNGDLPTPPVLTVEGPATDVSLRNSTLENTPFVRFNGSLAGGAVLTIDFANLTADVDGLNVLSLLDGNQGGLPDAGGIGGGPPAWFQLAPGANALHQGGGGTGTIDFADAYQ